MGKVEPDLLAGGRYFREVLSLRGRGREDQHGYDCERTHVPPSTHVSLVAA
jgi:hypothetical protein